MIKYFSIHNSLNERTMGKIPQVKEVIHNCHVYDNPNFIGKFPYKKIKINPVLSNPILFSKSKQTDLLQISSIGFSCGSMLISDKFKQILEQFNCFGIQFFSTYILHKNKKNDNYWQTHIYEIPYDFIDFEKTEVILKDRDNERKLIQTSLENINKNKFLKMTQSLEYPKMLFLKKISFIENMSLDYFFLRYDENSTLGVVSESLKNELEKQELTGIEFKPLNLSLNEWFSSGSRNDKYGSLY